MFTETTNFTLQFPLMTICKNNNNNNHHQFLLSSFFPFRVNALYLTTLFSLSITFDCSIKYFIIMFEFSGLPPPSFRLCTIPIASSICSQLLCRLWYMSTFAKPALLSILETVQLWTTTRRIAYILSVLDTSSKEYQHKQRCWSSSTVNISKLYVKWDRNQGVIQMKEMFDECLCVYTTKCNT